MVDVVKYFNLLEISEEQADDDDQSETRGGKSCLSDETYLRSVQWLMT